ncbi:hypothetical protein YK48G_19470 [Lentilactobacillus fungorum]|uniref:Uncharacterized protein n=1 Tax=Lentilactobacillus fungorum TaxID=2201250 RepID=A0ABQ3W252_9LACO|nr:hypothetical protein [Lentilactobacillus fungorum]GHP14522.1 hypothetical protein YK48G_19470 [Lentilactobacillus fungorum]
MPKIGNKQAKRDGFMAKHPATKLGKKKAAKLTSNQKMDPKTVRLINNGYIYRNRNLSYASHFIVSFNGDKFTANRKTTVISRNGKRAVYYHVTNSKLSGWVWHGNTDKY